MTVDAIIRTPRQVPAGRHVEWRTLVRDQHGVVGRAQLLQLGVTQSVIEANVEAGRWRRILHGVYAMFTGPPYRHQRLVAGLLYAGEPAVLSHRTAAEEWHILPVREDAPTHITVPYTCSARSVHGEVQLHRSRAFAQIAVENGQLPRTRLADTIVDVAVAADDARTAVHQLVALANTAPVRLTQIDERMRLRPPRRYVKELRAALVLAAGGVQSALEAEYAIAVERAHALPEGQRQVPLSVDGRTLWEDVTYDHVQVPLTVRLDGRQFHSTPGVAFRDRRRDNVAELAGRSRLVYGWEEVRHEPCEIANEVVTVLRRHGWSGTTSRCPLCH